MRSPAPDFLRPLPRRSPIAWIVAGASLAALGVSALEGVTLRQQAQSGSSATVVADAPEDAAPLDPPALAEARERLARPWPGLLEAVEAIDVPGLEWTSLDLNERGELRLEGTVRDAPSALAAAESLRRSRLWHDVVLGRVVVSDDAATRFELLAMPKGAAR